MRFSTVYTMPFRCAGKPSYLWFACAGALALRPPRSPATGGSPRWSRIRRTRSHRQAYYFILVFAGIVFVGVEGALITMIVKIRRGKRPRAADGLDSRLDRLEILWTVVPVVILAAIGIFIFVKLPEHRERPRGERGRLDHGQSRGTPVLLDVPLSERRDLGRDDDGAREQRRERGVYPANDVVHSWWVPQLAGKIDAIRAASSTTAGSRRPPASTRPAARILRHRAHEDAGDGGRRPARPVREVHRRARREPDVIALGQEEYSTCARCATCSTRPMSARRSPRTRC